MMMKYTFVLFIALLLSGTAVAQSPPDLTPRLPLPNNPILQNPVQPAQTVAPTQWTGQYGGSTDFSTATAVTQLKWQSLWRWVGSGPPQTLNPGTEMGVMVHLGERPTGGYTVRVLRTYVEDQRFVIEFTEVVPAPDKYVAQVFTQPWVIALVPYSELPVVFKKYVPVVH